MGIVSLIPTLYSYVSWGVFRHLGVCLCGQCYLVLQGQKPKGLFQMFPFKWNFTPSRCKLWRIEHTVCARYWDKRGVVIITSRPCILIMLNTSIYACIDYPREYAIIQQIMLGLEFATYNFMGCVFVKHVNLIVMTNF